MTRTLQRSSFNAMGTVCTIAVNAGARDSVFAGHSVEAATREIAACERALSRFDARSDLSRLNHAEGAWVSVDERLISALADALRGRTMTRGRYDPTILPALVAAGYDRSFERLTGRATVPLLHWQAGARIELDPEGGRARLERGAAVDLGGIGKGFAASRALQAMTVAWPALPGALVDLGGDIALWGVPPEGGLWRVDIADPRSSERVIGTLELVGGAGVATSGRDTRRFGPAGRLHHLIDPATGAPAVDGPLSITVTAANATDAEMHATALAMADVVTAREYIVSCPGVAALFVPEVGQPLVIGRLPLASSRAPARFIITTQTGRFAWQ